MENVEISFMKMVKTFRRECHRVSRSERTTVHGPDNMLMVLQLAIADVNKKQSGEFKVALSDVLNAWKHLLLDKLHLQPPDCAHLENYDLIRETYESFLKRSNTMDLVDLFFKYQQLKLVSDPDESLSPTQVFEFLSGNNGLLESSDSSVPSTPSKHCIAKVNAAVRKVFCSYLSLLVNTKNDLAVALTLDVPSRALGHQTFTDIKYAARKNNTSLFLAVTSFVRAIQLGGKGYAPPQEDPLRKHVKGLSEYVQFIDNLEEILGEVPDPSICGARLVSAIKSALVKGCCNGDAVKSAAEEMGKQLTDRICQLHELQKRSANVSGTGISPARPKAYAVNHATAYGGRDTVKVLLALLDEEALAPPCQNKADLLSEDQPTLNGAQAICVLSLFRSPEVSTGSSPEPLKNRVRSRLDLIKPKPTEKLIRSQFACTYNDEELPLNRVLDFPSTSQVPTCVHPAPKITPRVAEKDEAKSSQCSELIGAQQGTVLGARSGNGQKQGVGVGSRKKTAPQEQGKGSKRKQADSGHIRGSENEPPRKRPLCTKSVNNALNKKKLIAGQGKLTSFFRV
ncbi:PCNA-interacting partner [Synchiropus splendidus]|uniref:PCNA-interacting partner n=1 Tax=Synchiropus splendidus TaxID=270530 RepID=UPI00237DB2AD|nr:PCNA-interacting partner [Synchiropus splendidus]XP_053719778.1 PCNA-interacting partner [Synchiropus splendidus]